MLSEEETNNLIKDLYRRRLSCAILVGSRCAYYSNQGTIREAGGQNFVVDFDSDFMSSTGEPLRTARVGYLTGVELLESQRRLIEETPIDKAYIKSVKEDDARVSQDIEDEHASRISRLKFQEGDHDIIPDISAVNAEMAYESALEMQEQSNYRDSDKIVDRVNSTGKFLDSDLEFFAEHKINPITQLVYITNKFLDVVFPDDIERKSKRPGCLYLDYLEFLSVDIARRLAKEAKELHFGALKVIGIDALSELKEVTNLHLDGLAEVEGSMLIMLLERPFVSLCGLTSISKPQAEIISQNESGFEELGLNGVTDISDEIVDIFVSDPSVMSKICMHGLERASDRSKLMLAEYDILVMTDDSNQDFTMYYERFDCDLFALFGIMSKRIWRINSRGLESYLKTESQRKK